MKTLLAVLFAALMLPQAKDNTPPPGFTALFNGKDLTGWQGLVDVKKRKKMDKQQYEDAVKKATENAFKKWTVMDGVIHYTPRASNLQTVKDYGNFELYVDYKIEPNGDS